MPGKRSIHLGEQLRHHVEQVLVEEIQAPGDLLRDGGFLQLELPGEPEQLDFIRQRLDQFLALAIRPARRFELEQPQVDAPMALEHRDPLGLGRMRGDHRPHAQLGQGAAESERADALRRSRRKHAGESAAQLIVAALALDFAPIAHVAILFRDREQLEPDALRLQRAREQLAGIPAVVRSPRNTAATLGS